MKFITILLTLVIFPTILLGQTSHLEIKGIPLTGDINCFVNRMEEKGDHLYTMDEDNNVILKGTFAGDSCLFTIFSTYTSHQPYKIIVTRPFKKNILWKRLESKFKDLAKAYTIKYDSPKEERDVKFIYINDYRVSAQKVMQYDSFIYSDKFDAEDGIISLNLEDQFFEGVMQPVMNIIYQDNINAELHETEKLKALNKDI